ncbi:MAG: coproporphyrinogen III oxidase, partial [Verrucomicrobiota bacterium]
IDEGESAIYRAYPTDEDERLIREFILQLKLGKVYVSYYQKKFGVNVLERFKAPLDYLVQEGWMAVEGDVISLSRSGLLQVDRLLHTFFLPKHRNARYT